MSKTKNHKTFQGDVLSNTGDSAFAANTAAYIATGTNAITLNPVDTTHTPSVLTDGMECRFVATADNTGATTVNVVGLGIKAIKSNGFSDELVGGSILTGKLYRITFNVASDAFELGVTDTVTYNTDTIMFTGDATSDDGKLDSADTGNTWISVGGVSNTDNWSHVITALNSFTASKLELKARALSVAGATSNEEHVAELECIIDFDNSTIIGTCDVLAGNDSSVNEIFNLSSALSAGSATYPFISHVGTLGSEAPKVIINSTSRIIEALPCMTPSATAASGKYLTFKITKLKD